MGNQHDMAERDWFYERRRILIEAHSATEALKTLFEARKSRFARFSLGVISKKTGASKGYLSDVLSGRRNLNARYWDSMAEVFGLEDSAKHLFVLLLKRDTEDQPTELQNLDAEINAYRKALGMSVQIMPKVQGLFFALEVFVAFGLFKNQPMREDLRNYYGVSRSIELDYALHHLKSMHLIEERDGRFYLLKDHLNFLGSEDGLSFKDYLKESLLNALRQLDAWHERTDEAFIESTLLSVQRATLRGKLPEIRDAIHKMQADLESASADTMIHFNIQVFPTSSD